MNCTLMVRFYWGEAEETVLKVVSLPPRLEEVARGPPYLTSLMRCCKRARCSPGSLDGVGVMGPRGFSESGVNSLR
jgi:hypothetical protein